MKLFVAIYDDARLLEHFLRHYRKSGITDFFIAIDRGVAQAVNRVAGEYGITVVEGLDVRDSWLGGNAAITEMRRQHQAVDEWALIVDLDEFVEFEPVLPKIVALADGEGANAVVGIMYDRFSADGKLVGFAPDSDLAAVYPVKARFIRKVMGGFDEKRVLVKGLLPAKVAHHTFEGERLCSTVLEIAHYKWNDRAMDRVRLAYQDLVERGCAWAFEYKNIIDHYEKFNRFRWEDFGGELVSRQVV
jgi:hypothetical protein